MFTVTRDEVRDLTIAFFVLSFCFAISNVGFDFHGIVSLLPIVMFGVGFGFIAHELGHKYTAMKCGCEAEFKLWPLGLLIAFVTALIGIVFASPGEAKIYPEDLSDEINGRIGIAGPMANIGLALLFIVIALFLYPFSFHSNIFHLLFLVCTVGFSVNSFLATFNILPLWSLDGTKVMKWSPKYWLAGFLLAALMMLSSVCIGAENMVMMLIA